MSNHRRQEWIDKLAQFCSVYPIATPRMLLFRGRLQVLSGNTHGGRASLRKSISAAQSLTMPYDEALAKHHISKHAANPREAERSRKEASEIFTRLGVSMAL